MEKFKAVRIFLRVVEAQSFVQAANSLDLTPSAVSKSVSALESELGVQLLKRSTRSLSLTSEGALYYERCRQLSEDYDDVEAMLRGIYQTPQGRLRIDVTLAIARFVILPALPSFLERYPQIQLELSANERHVDLIQEGYDAVIRIGKPKDSNLQIQPLSAIRLSTYASPKYLSKCDRPLVPKDLLKHNCLPYAYQPSGQKAAWLFERNGKQLSLEVSGSFSSNDPTALISAAVAGVGICQTFCFVVAEYLKSGALEPILSNYSTTGFPVSLLYPATRHLSVKLRLFATFIQEQFQRLDAQYDNNLEARHTSMKDN